ncbi:MULTISPECIES: RrF2 family transcriptional regulator [Eggerthella]|uniref:RrF2 family transcriptional regulator n=1 Tax=Eggerthella TaxID=84111 RepID=UPI000E437E40|nr:MULTISPECIES: Rrf2 family transcriptional regulator [Eggerthella]MCG4741016.1 Rrf2 family transcriptional regulator [Eggerthella lenta]MCG4776248.1 Rrf2 family transcriptional regulator [Eggerthella lenta]MDB1756655.1 Rrf2 family transcriptional regulator [Eggerthella lenta]MDB1763245.1 Rrf2 family transcriptional regulator [Eggerthella lenta]MDU2821463.1 Rrf2 family transcriptional regulator [Eggerthella lenta]
MLISTTNDYALRMCAYLARQGGIASSKEIADAVGVSREYLIQIAQRLRNAGIVEARPGKHGGYRLAKEPGDVSALDVVRAVNEAAEPVRLGSEAERAKRQTLDELASLRLTEVM